MATLAPLSFYRDCVARACAADKTSEPDAAAACGSHLHFSDVHIASSCLQKALRRGDEGAALAAARLLAKLDPERLWRRLTVCAFEDFGLVDVSVTARVTAVATSKSFRLVVGEERLIRYLITLLCEQPKDRRLDDLYALAKENHQPREAGPLGKIIAPLVHEASRLVVRCEHKVPGRSFHVLSSEACERALVEMGRAGMLGEGLYELCSLGLRRSRCLLPLLLPLALEASQQAGGLGEVHNESLPQAPLIAGVPAYAIDGFTRPGRAVLARLGQEEPRLGPWLRLFVPALRADFLHHLLFFAEGARSSPLVRDPLSEALRDHALSAGTKLSLPAAREAVALMGELLPSVHALRRSVFASTPSEELP
jgi:hypothetical protein